LLAALLVAALIVLVALGLKIVFTIVLALLALAVVLYFVGHFVFRDDRRPDEVHFTQAADGHELGLWRVRPKGDGRQAVPVVLQHGLGANHRDFDLEDRCSLAHYLARHGYDCYLPALRGCGPSRYRKWSHPDKWAIDFDKFVELDLPAVFAKVEQLTGAKTFHYIGHSMGGMIGYALAQGEQAARLRSLTAVASPCFFEHMQHFAPVLRLRPLLKVFVVIRQSILTTMQASIVYFFPKLAGNYVVNPENVDGALMARASVNLIEDMPRDLLLQFGRWVEDRVFGSHRPEPWQTHLHKIQVPIYCLGGTADFFCPPAANDQVVNHVRSPKKQYRRFGKTHGHQADYGHGDIVVGQTAPQEVWPTILDWLHENE
jgi:pimeloyl-ACP methyl ester carboxylesterase